MSSAAAVGVSARLSATKSQRVKSVWCPTAEITGALLARTARTSASSLKPQRSSIEPPPRPTTMRSIPGIALASLSPLITEPGQVSPWTRAGTNQAVPFHPRVFRTSMKSCQTAPLSEVTNATTFGKSGKGRFNASSKRPSAVSLAWSSLNFWNKSPSPAGFRESTINESFPVGA